MSPEIQVLSLTVTTGDPEAAQRAWDVLMAATPGLLALTGVTVSAYASTTTDDEE